MWSLAVPDKRWRKEQDILIGDPNFFAVFIFGKTDVVYGGSGQCWEDLWKGKPFSGLNIRTCCDFHLSADKIQDGQLQNPVCISKPPRIGEIHATT